MKNFIQICQSVLVLMGLMACGLFVTSFIGLLPIGTPLGFAYQWTIFSCQNIFAFILPALITWRMCFHADPLYAIGANQCPSNLMVSITFLLYFLTVPFLNQTVYWNQEIHLPEFLQGFETWCREMEKLAEQQTASIINTTDIIPTLVNIAIIGLLTGIGEEFFFRGGLQRILTACHVNPHLAIWSAAFVFSALHFQFFGFIPRLLLGALFGYLYWWTGNIWINSIAHALNNSLVIISNWCIRSGILSEEFDMIGVKADSFPLPALLSATMTGLTIYLLYRYKVIPASNRTAPRLNNSDF